MVTAYGNRIFLNDHDEKENYAGRQRGIIMQSTSTHRFEMIDHTNEQNVNPRIQGNVPAPLAKKAYVRIRSGYGLEFLMLTV